MYTTIHSVICKKHRVNNENQTVDSTIHRVVSTKLQDAKDFIPELMRKYTLSYNTLYTSIQHFSALAFS